MGLLIDFFLEKAYNAFEDQKTYGFSKELMPALVPYFFGGFYGEYFEFTGWN